MVLTPILEIGNLGDQIVITSLLAWHQLILFKTCVCQLKAATSTAYMDLLGRYGS